LLSDCCCCWMIKSEKIESFVEISLVSDVTLKNNEAK